MRMGSQIPSKAPVLGPDELFYCMLLALHAQLMDFCMHMLHVIDVFYVKTYIIKIH